jgi:hypothetical protein
MPIRAFLDICWKSRLVCDLKDFDFLHCELLCAREQVPESGVVRTFAVTPVSANVSPTASVCVAVIGNINAITKYWTQFGITNDCQLLPFRRQREFPRRDAVRIPQREEETPQAIVALQAIALMPRLPVPHPRLPLHRREADENVPICVRYQSQSIRAAVAAALKPSRLPRHSRLRHFARNSLNSSGHSPTISDRSRTLREVQALQRAEAEDAPADRERPARVILWDGTTPDLHKGKRLLQPSQIPTGCGQEGADAQA